MSCDCQLIIKENDGDDDDAVYVSFASGLKPGPSRPGLAKLGPMGVKCGPSKPALAGPGRAGPGWAAF